MVYTIYGSQTQADYVTTSLWKLANHDAGTDGEVTTKLFGVIKHPTLSQWAVCIPSSYTIAIDPLADPEPIVTLYSSVATTQEIANFRAAVQAGGQINIVQFMPQAMMATVKSQEQMTADGWFPSIS